MTQTGKTTTIIIIILIVIGVTIGVNRGGKTEEQVNKQPIKIGFIAPLSGDAAVYGEPVANGVRLAEKEINAAGGVNGRKVEVIYEDGKCSGKDAATAAQKLVNVDKVKFIIGGVCSGEVFGYAPITEAAHVLTITPGGSNPEVSKLGDYVFRNALNDAKRGVLLADYAAKSFKKVAIITEKTDYAIGLRDVFIARAKGINLQVVASEEFTSDSKDFRSLLSKMKEANPDVVFLNAQADATLVRLTQQARTLGLKQQFLASEFNGATVAAEKTAEGIIVAVSPTLATDGKAKVFVDAYKVMFSKEPDYAFYAAAAYDSLNLFATGIKQNGEDVEKVKNYLYTVANYNGVTGTYSFDVNGDVEGIDYIFQQLKDGKFVEVK